MARNITDTTTETGIVKEDFSVILSQAFATYGLSVVTDRALPDARDGLKPVQRRILSGMLEARYLSSRSTVKSAEVVGFILGNYHPHGDASVYDASVRMAQPFTMRYPLIEGQGNMGSEDGDDPAAYRYTEMRLSPIAEALMADIERDTVPLHPTYKQDPKVVEPDYLPGRLPPIVNPSSGIAVGLSTNIPPHNLSEVMRACIALLDQPTMSVEQLMTYIQGPDFCQGGRIIGVEGIRDYFKNGKGRIIVRGEVRLEETPRSRSLVVTQIPPIGRDKLKASIVKAINARKLEGLMPDVRDESDTEKGTRIVLELRKDADAAQVLSQLYNDTDLQIALSFQVVFLFGSPMEAARQPKQVGLIELLNYWNAHQIDILTRRTEFDLRKARERLHVVEGLIIGSTHAAEIVKIFQEAEDRASARREIEQRYALTAIQSDVIASMTLAQVTRLDASKYGKEQNELGERITQWERLLSDRKALISLLKKEMQQLIKQFGDERRTTIDAESTIHTPIEVVESLHEREPMTVAFTAAGAVKVLPVDTYKPRAKNGDSEAIYTPVRGDEQLRQIIETTSQDYLLCVSSTGRVFQIASHRIPVATRSAKGEPLANLLELAPDEEIVTILPIDSYDEDRYLVTFSALGKVKKSPLSEYKTTDVDGLPDMKLAEGDTLLTALISRGRGEYFVTASNAQTLRFSDEQLRAQGRVGQGVAAMALGKGATVVSASYLDSERGESMDLTSLLIVTQSGLAKKVPVGQYPQKGRATTGVVSTELSDDDQILLAMFVQEDQYLLISWKNGKTEQATTLKASALKAFTRARKGEPVVFGPINHVLILQ
ncbi:DNA gyrase/topoisomerase IV subunit A [Tengunoibacter tsumagoiensis]|uniref:DNA topoisomerase (ATP-hydrolyzing) n=1 Tax=Tengunoibacter tsumagoiensis TaxID=2014871 RepID=A0A402A207_9CHLR|nr:DNA gyrase subunit A [Tengunoibacter tsumagoiensis]GCE13180.1 DNA gyrase subunit A [Tengunoibacter tsumagoiensis]